MKLKAIRFRFVRIFLFGETNTDLNKDWYAAALSYPKDNERQLVSQNQYDDGASQDRD